MRTMVLCALVALAACNLDFPGLTALDDAALVASESAMVADVLCSSDSLAIATHETGACTALNADGTRVQVSGYAAVPRWRSSHPARVSIALDGQIRAESQPGEVWIYAAGTHGSVDSLRVVAH